LLNIQDYPIKIYILQNKNTFLLTKTFEWSCFGCKAQSLFLNLIVVLNLENLINFNLFWHYHV